MELSDILLWIAIVIAVFSDKIDRAVKAGGKLRRGLTIVGMIAAAVFAALKVMELLNR